MGVAVVVVVGNAMAITIFLMLINLSTPNTMLSVCVQKSYFHHNGGKFKSFVLMLHEEVVK